MQPLIWLSLTSIGPMNRVTMNELLLMRQKCTHNWPRSLN